MKGGVKMKIKKLLKKEIYLIFCLMLMQIMVTPEIIIAQKLEPIRIGALLPLTGVSAEDGLQQQRAVNLAFDEVGWQIAGRQIKLFVEDDANTPSVGLTKLKKLFHNDKIDILIGPMSSAVALAIHPFIRDNKILTIGIMAAAEELNTGGNFVKSWFRVSYCAGNQTGNVVAYAAYKRGYRKGVFIGADYVTGHAEARGVKRVFEKLGGKMVQEIYVPLGTMDMAPYLVKIDPTADFITTFFFGADAPRFTRQYVEYGLKGRIPLFTFGSAVDLPYLKAHGEAAIGMESVYHYCENLNIPEMKKLRKTFIEKYKTDIGWAVDAAYLAARVVILGLEAVKGKIEDVDKVVEAIEKLDFISTRGRFRFGPEHNPIHDYYLRRVEMVEGKLQNVVVEVFKDVGQGWMPPSIK